MLTLACMDTMEGTVNFAKRLTAQGEKVGSWPFMDQTDLPCEEGFARPMHVMMPPYPGRSNRLAVLWMSQITVEARNALSSVVEDLDKAVPTTKVRRGHTHHSAVQSVGTLHTSSRFSSQVMGPSGYVIHRVIPCQALDATAVLTRGVVVALSSCSLHRRRSAASASG